MSTVTNRSEILFIYHVKDANPNGDPLDENKPRTDPDTGVATVTDVRIKRTIRDYWYQNLHEEILVRDTFTEEGYLKDGKGRSRSFLEDASKVFDNVLQAEAEIKTAILDLCIDARVFGCTLPVEVNVKKTKGKKDVTEKEKGSVTLTGPVQFSGFNRSLHRVAPTFVQGTAAFASSDAARQKSFREDYLLPYACIAAYGIVNEIAARTTNMSDDDVEKVLEGLWRGTENLISRSKMGHQPLLLMHIEYADNFRIGDLASRIKLVPHNGTEATKLRDPSEFTIVASALSSAIDKSGGKVLRKRMLRDESLDVDGLSLTDFETLSFGG